MRMRFKSKSWELDINLIQLHFQWLIHFKGFIFTSEENDFNRKVNDDFKLWTIIWTQNHNQFDCCCWLTDHHFHHYNLHDCLTRMGTESIRIKNMEIEVRRNNFLPFLIIFISWCRMWLEWWRWKSVSAV